MAMLSASDWTVLSLFRILEFTMLSTVLCIDFDVPEALLLAATLGTCSPCTPVTELAVNDGLPRAIMHIALGHLSERRIAWLAPSFRRDDNLTCADVFTTSASRGTIFPRLPIGHLAVLGFLRNASRGRCLVHVWIARVHLLERTRTKFTITAAVLLYAASALLHAKTRGRAATPITPQMPFAVNRGGARNLNVAHLRLYAFAHGGITAVSGHYFN
jgi:hypothetical protein